MVSWTQCRHGLSFLGIHSSIAVGFSKSLFRSRPVMLPPCSEEFNVWLWEFGGKASPDSTLENIILDTVARGFKAWLLKMKSFVAFQICQQMVATLLIKAMASLRDCVQTEFVVHFIALVGGITWRDGKSSKPDSSSLVTTNQQVLSRFNTLRTDRTKKVLSTISGKKDSPWLQVRFYILSTRNFWFFWEVSNLQIAFHTELGEVWKMIMASLSSPFFTRS